MESTNYGLVTVIIFIISNVIVVTIVIVVDVDKVSIVIVSIDIINMELYICRMRTLST